MVGPRKLERGAYLQVDIEDIGGAGPRRGKKGTATAAAAAASNGGSEGGPPEMLNALIRGSLTKQVRLRAVQVALKVGLWRLGGILEG